MNKFRFKLVARAIAAFLGAWLAWEVVLRNTVIRRPGYATHSELGRIYKPGTYVHGTEGYSRTRINSLGFRDTWEPRKDQARQRILFLGDSFSEALQVRDGKSFVDLIERSAGWPVEAINAGRSGGSPAHYIHLRSFYLQQIRPSQVVIQLNNGDFLEDALNTRRNFYIVTNGTSYTTVHNKTFSSANPLMQKLGMLRGLLEFSTIALAAESVKFIIQSRKSPAVTVSSAARPDQDGDGLKELVRWTIRELQKYPRAIILYIPNLNYGHLNETPATEFAIEAACHESGVPLVNMRNAFIEHYQNTYEPAHGFANQKPGTGHLNEVGHQLTARELLKQMKAVPAP
jgi:hypothetical protein